MRQASRARVRKPLKRLRKRTRNHGTEEDDNDMDFDACADSVDGASKLPANE